MTTGIVGGGDKLMADDIASLGERERAIKIHGEGKLVELANENDELRRECERLRIALTDANREILRYKEFVGDILRQAHSLDSD